MKKLVIFLIILLLPAFIFPRITYRFVPSGYKSNAVFSEIFLDVFGEEAYLKMLYLNRNRHKRFGVYQIITTDSIVHHDHLKPVFTSYNNDSIYKLILNQQNYIHMLDSGFHAREKDDINDTMFLFADIMPYGRDLVRVLPKLKNEITIALSLIYPYYNILDEDIVDTLSWEREAMRSVKKRIEEGKRDRVHFLEPFSPIPDSLKTLYEIYNR